MFSLVFVSASLIAVMATRISIEFLLAGQLLAASLTLAWSTVIMTIVLVVQRVVVRRLGDMTSQVISRQPRHPRILQLLRSTPGP